MMISCNGMLHACTRSFEQSLHLSVSCFVCTCMYEYSYLRLRSSKQFCRNVTQSILFHGVFQLSTLSHFSTVNRITSHLSTVENQISPVNRWIQEKGFKQCSTTSSVETAGSSTKIQTSNTHEHVNTANLGWQKINSEIVRIFFTRICCVYISK